MVALKKELAELKAARGKDAGSRVSAAAAAAMAHGARGGQESLEAMITPDMMELQMEKQAHLETFATLDISEQCVCIMLTFVDDVTRSPNTTTRPSNCNRPYQHIEK